VVTALTATAPAAANPLAGRQLYVDHTTAAARASAAATGTDAVLLRRISSQPQARWFDGQSNRRDVAAYVATAARHRATALLVVYDLPDRDCGGYSAGGAASAAAYRSWLTHSLVAGIGNRPAAVILEPDALAELGCLSAAGQRSYYSLLAYAVRTLAAHRQIAVYLDAGNSTWQPVGVIAARLRAAGVARARGFSLNVSNFNSTAAEAAYGHRVSRLIGRRPFVIDTSRNGNGPAPSHAWCNPPGRALGQPPSTSTGDPLIDAYLWIKAPGESDGTCNGGPAAGVFWPEYALALARG
jgi:endoglucanase